MFDVINIFFKKIYKFFCSQKLSVYQGSFLFKLWEKPPLDVFIKVYVFNVTNTEAFLNGTDKKLKLQEIGPYVYQWVLYFHNKILLNNK